MRRQGWEGVCGSWWEQTEQRVAEARRGLGLVRARVRMGEDVGTPWCSTGGLKGVGPKGQIRRCLRGDARGTE
jgi:hypothetical protein